MGGKSENKASVRFSSGKEMKCTVQRNGSNFVFSLEGYGVYMKLPSNDSDADDDNERGICRRR